MKKRSLVQWLSLDIWILIIFFSWLVFPLSSKYLIGWIGRKFGDK